MRPKTVLAVGAIFAFLAVAAGAFGAHALRESVTPERLDVFRTAVRYQFFHALALLVVGRELSSRPAWGWAALFFIAGTLIFSGSLYALVLLDRGWLGAVTPLGGLAFLTGWVFVLAGVLRSD
jgi:uncharacterized membrane protein YgdD (TMEM256/DUF423 family)